MSPQSARSMVWASLALFLAGGMVGSPETGVAAAALAGCCATAALIYGTKGVRIAAALILAASVGLSLALFPAARENMAGYRDQARSAPVTVPPGTAGAQ